MTKLLLQLRCTSPTLLLTIVAIAGTIAVAQTPPGESSSLVISSAITYVPPSASYGQHVFAGTNVAGYASWGAHADFPETFTIDGTIKFYENSAWYIMQTVESFNGQGRNPYTGQSSFLDWFSPSAFGGTNYSFTPVGAVSHVDEPNDGVNDPYYYFGLWTAGKNLAICAWNSRVSGSDYVQAVGDPFVRR